MDRSSNESAGADERSAVASTRSSSSTDGTGHAVDKARGTVKQELRSARDDVQQRAADTVNRQKHRVADRLDAIVHALSAAQESLRDDEQPQLARYVDDLTRQVERSTGYLRNNDFGGMMRDMEDLARNNTGVFLGSTFVAGMAMGRFLRSSEPEQPGGELTGDWRGETQSRGAGAGGTGAYGTGVAGSTSAFGTSAYDAGPQQGRGSYEGGAGDTYRGATGPTAFERETDATRGTQSDAGTERTRETWGEER